MLTPRGTNYRSRLAVLGCALLLTAACQGDPPASPSDDKSTAETTTEPTAEPTTEPEFVQASADDLDPCSMVPRDTWLKLVPPGHRKTALAEQQLVDNALPFGSGGTMTGDYNPKYACIVTYPSDGPAGVHAALSWGWYIGQFGAPKVNKMFAILGGTEHNQGTYAAVTGGDLLFANAVGITPSHTGFFVVVDAPVNTPRRQQTEPDEDGKGEVFTMDRRMLEILDFISHRVDAQPPVKLADGCPPTRDSAIKAVMGQVAYARGYNDGAGSQFCLYRSTERGTVLRLEAGIHSESVIDSYLEESASAKDRFKASSGMTGRALVTENGVGSAGLVQPDELRYAVADVEHSDFAGASRPIPRQAMINLVESFFASAQTTPVE